MSAIRVGDVVRLAGDPALHGIVTGTASDSPHAVVRRGHLRVRPLCGRGNDVRDVLKADVVAHWRRTGAR